MRIVGLMLVLAMALAACGGDGDSSQSATLDQGENGSTVTLEQGETLTVELDANPTTGFEWQVISEPNPMVLEVEGSNYVAGEGDGVGGGGVETWTFRAVGAGEATVVLSYSQPFEPDDVAETFTFQAMVE